MPICLVCDYLQTIAIVDNFSGVIQHICTCLHVTSDYHCRCQCCIGHHCIMSDCWKNVKYNI